MRKRNGEIRMCIDCRKLNSITKISPFPIPNMTELIESLGQRRIYTSLDLEQGCHQISVKEEDKFKTVFICREGLFEYNKMSFGLINAPYVFQK